jgi:hypothetical protein
MQQLSFEMSCVNAIAMSLMRSDSAGKVGRNRARRGAYPGFCLPIRERRPSQSTRPSSVRFSNAFVVERVPHRRFQ